MTPRNNNRELAYSSNVSLVKDPTINTEGTKVAGFLAGSNKIAGIVLRKRENVLAKNTNYLMKITSSDTGNNISWDAQWYEV